MIVSGKVAKILLPLLAALALVVIVFTDRVSSQESQPVCFWSTQGPVCVERTVKLGAAGPDPRGLLAALVAGPTPQEQARGIWSAIPAGTTPEGLKSQPDGTVWVRLAVPLKSLGDLDDETFEMIVRQVGWTLEPLGWRELHIQTWDPIAGAFVPLADFLPQLPDPRKETVLSGEETSLHSGRSGSGVGQPPAPGQAQPQGGLSGKTVYVSAGHGWQWDGSAWRVQRIPYPRPPYEGPIIEDHNNAEAVNQYLLQYLWNAGAQVWPVRERDMNGAEVIVNDESPQSGTGYSETGAWATVSGTGYADGDYRQIATVAGAPTATAVWTATLPADGKYAVYVWYRPGCDRAPDASYTVHHAGGQTTVGVDQQHHGVTWHYIGTYGFRAGQDARVVLTNQSAKAERVVVADAVRFGGGTFNDLTGIETSAPYPPDEPWWEVAAYYHVQRMGMGCPPGDVTARPRYARWEHAATGDDAVYLSWHTNGVSGYQWHSHGTVSIIHNGDGLPITPGSEALRDAVHGELVQDIRSGWDPSWPGYERSMNLGELRQLWDSDPTVCIPGALIEVAYHDHPDDTDALKEPRFNLLAARAMYQGIVKYFEQRDGVDMVELPEPPTHLAVRNAGDGQVRVSWRASLTDTVDLVGDPASGYRVYTSTNGLGWSNGTSVATTVYTITELSEGQLVFVRVAATNDGGESFPTETLAARVGDEAGVLLVSGFDRLNNTMLVPEYYAPTNESNQRMFLDRINQYNYMIQHGEVISYPFDGACNEAVRDGSLDLGDYAMVDWFLGEESVSDETLDALERALLREFLVNGGALFLSGTEVGYHLDQNGAGEDSAFFRDVLRAKYTGDDADTYEVKPAEGSIFEGLGSFRFDASGFYDADYPDQMEPIGGSVAALVYEGGQGGTAAVQYADGCERLVYFGFPFETISPDRRADVMERVLDFLDECLARPVNTKIITPSNGSAHRVVPAFAGTATPGDGAIEWVGVHIQRIEDGHYWTGSEWVTTTLDITGTASFTNTAWVTATGMLTWSYELPALGDGDYRLRARAWMTDGIVDPSPAEGVFTYDTISPTGTTLITPTGGITVASGTATLMWEPVEPDGGSDLAYVLWLDGDFYTTTQSVYTVTSVANGSHTWSVHVFDAAGNRSEWVTSTFHVRWNACWLPMVMYQYAEERDPCADVIVNGGFESDAGWVLNQLAIYDTAPAPVRSGERSVRVGIPPGGSGIYSYSSVTQTVSLPMGSAGLLRFWAYAINEADDSGDLHYIWLAESGEGYEALDQTTSDGRYWEQREYDLSRYLGRTVTLYIGVKNDGDDDTAALYVDDVTLEVWP